MASYQLIVWNRNGGGGGGSGGGWEVSWALSPIFVHTAPPLLAVIADPSWVGTEEWQEGYLKQTTCLVGCFHGFYKDPCSWWPTGRLFDHFIHKILNPSELTACCQLPSRWPYWTSSKMGNNYALRLVLRAFFACANWKAQPEHNKVSIVLTLPSGDWGTFSTVDFPHRHQVAK